MKNNGIASAIKGRNLFFVFLAAAALFLTNTGQTIAEDDNDLSMETVDDKAKTMYELALNGQFEEAKKIHSWLIKEFPGVSFDDYNLTSPQLSEIFRAFDRAGEAVTNVDMQDRKRLQYIFSFRLAVDAVISEKNPLWKKSGQQLLLLLDEVEQKLKNEEPKQAMQLYYQWQSEFEVIRPALYTGREKEQYTPLVSYIRFVDNQSWDDADKQSQVEELKRRLRAVVENNKYSSVDPSLWTVILSVGSVLFVSLTYTGWRKYKGEKQRHQMRD